MGRAGQTSNTTARRFRDTWPDLLGDVIERLSPGARDAVLVLLPTLKDPEFVWNLAHQFTLTDSDTWSRLVKNYENIDTRTVLPILSQLVTDELEHAGAQCYQIAARRLKRMRQLAAGASEASAVDNLIAELRETHRGRPPLQLEFDRARLP